MFIFCCSDASPQVLTTFREQDNNLKCSIYVLGVNPLKPHEIALGGCQSIVNIYDTRNCKESLSVICPNHMVGRGDDFSVTGLQYNYSGEEIVVSYNDEDVYTMSPTKHNQQNSSTNRQDQTKEDSNYGEEESSDDRNDYFTKFTGHRNCETVKQISYMGPRSEYIASGSDCGHVFIWNSQTSNLVKLLKADNTGAVNCLTPHEHLPILATSGLDDTAKLWAPMGDSSLVSRLNRSDDDLSISVNSEENEDEIDDAAYVTSLNDSNMAGRREYEEFINDPQRNMMMRFFLRQFRMAAENSDEDDDDVGGMVDIFGGDSSSEVDISSSGGSDDGSNDEDSNENGDLQHEVRELVDLEVDECTQDNLGAVEGLSGTAVLLSRELMRQDLLNRVRVAATELQRSSDRGLSESFDEEEKDDDNDEEVEEEEEEAEKEDAKQSYTSKAKKTRKRKRKYNK